LKLIVLNASNEAEIETTFTEFSQQRIAVLLVGTDQFSSRPAATRSSRWQIV
jgi:hypothetical protein